MDCRNTAPSYAGWARIDLNEEKCGKLLDGEKQTGSSYDVHIDIETKAQQNADEGYEEPGAGPESREKGENDGKPHPPNKFNSHIVTYQEQVAAPPGVSRERFDGVE